MQSSTEDARLTGSKRQHDSARKLRITWNSIFLTLLLIGAKLAVGLSTNSLSILSQATDSGLDLVALLITLFAVRISAIPPDDDHLYGHGKFENLSALLQSLLLLVITGFIAYEAIHRLLSPEAHPVIVNAWSFGVLIGSMSIDFWRARILRKASKDHNSQALEATALNFMTDLLSGGVVIIGLALVKFTGWVNGDAWAAVAVSGFVAYLSLRLGKRAVDGLTDRFVESKEYDELQDLIGSTSGIEGVRRLRVRQAGPYYFIDVALDINRTLPFSAIERIVQEVERRVHKTYEDSDVTIHWYPVQTTRETPFETLKLVAAEFGLAPHNVEMTQNEAGETLLDYHLEFPPKTEFSRAAQLGRLVEETVRQQLPQISRVTTHLEEERSDVAPATVRDVTERRSDLLEGIRYIATSANRSVRAVRDIELMQSLETRELKLVLTLELAEHVSLAKAHDVATNVEDELRKRYPELGRIVVQVTPQAIEAT
jgi:cation diffusion facilitator family transporter